MMTVGTDMFRDIHARLNDISKSYTNTMYISPNHMTESQQKKHYQNFMMEYHQAVTEFTDYLEMKQPEIKKIQIYCNRYFREISKTYSCVTACLLSDGGWATSNYDPSRNKSVITDDA